MSPAAKPINFTLNGRRVAADVKPHHNVVEMLQTQFALFGARESCGQGLCGCCTVLVDGRPVSGCLHLAAFLDGTEVVTVEHLATSGKLDPVQQAFIECGAFQCGYCTPGQICSALGMLQEAEAGWPSVVSADLTAEHVTLDDDEIRERMSGNLCRCAAYANIVPAIREVREQAQEELQIEQVRQEA